MPSADKRQRKKENARIAREAREAAAKRKRRNRLIRNGAIAAVIFVGIVALTSWLGSGGKKKNNAASTPTTVPVTVNPAQLASVRCNDTVPPAGAPKNQRQKPPPLTIDPKKTYTATITTSCGSITVALDAKNAPKGVNNFVYLARQGFFDGLKFHRVVKDFVVQGGDPKGDGTGTPGYDNLVTELPADGYPLGTLAYAKTGSTPPGAAGSQFFIVTSNRPSALENKTNGSYQYGVFGHVATGLAIAKKMEEFAPASGDGAPTRPLYVFKVTITEK